MTERSKKLDPKSKIQIYLINGLIGLFLGPLLLGIFSGGLFFSFFFQMISHQLFRFLFVILIPCFILSAILTHTIIRINEMEINTLNKNKIITRGILLGVLVGFFINNILSLCLFLLFGKIIKDFTEFQIFRKQI